MKKLNFLLSLSIIATLLFASCSKEESVNVVEPAGNLVSITATTPNAIDTKAYLEEADGKVVTKWHEGDQISVYDAELGSHAFTLKNGAATTSGTFEGAATKELKAAAFPYSEESVYGFESGTLEGFIMPGTYDIDDHAAIPMFATVGENNNFQFKALGGFIQVRYENVPAEAKYLHFTVKDGFISGKYNLKNLNTDNFTSERTSTENSGDNEVTIALPKDAEDGIVTINIPVLGATYELNGFTMKLLDKSLTTIANSVKETNDKFSHQVKAGTIVRLPVVDLNNEYIKKTTIKEFLEAEVSDTQWYELTGKVENIWMDKKDKTKQNPYGNFDLVDENVKVHVHGLTATKTEDGKNDKSFSRLGLKEGDVITIHTLRQEYNNKPQGGGDTPAYFVSKKIFPEISVTGENSIAFDQTSLELNVASNCDWKVSAKSEDLTVTPESGNGDATIEVSFAKNDTEDAKEYSITFEATLDGETKSTTFTFSHEEEGAFVPETFYEITLGKKLPKDWSASANTYYDKDYPRFGTSSKSGSATTCALGITSPKAKFTFEIAAWDYKKEVSKLKLSIIGDGTFADDSKTMLIEGYAKEPNFTQIEKIIVGANAKTKIKFESKNKTNNRFFLKSVKVESCE